MTTYKQIRTRLLMLKARLNYLALNKVNTDSANFRINTITTKLLSLDLD
jgi:hypothetical protein